MLTLWSIELLCSTSSLKLDKVTLLSITPWPSPRLSSIDSRRSNTTSMTPACSVCCHTYVSPLGDRGNDDIPVSRLDTPNGWPVNNVTLLDVSCRNMYDGMG